MQKKLKYTTLLELVALAVMFICSGLLLWPDFVCGSIIFFVCAAVSICLLVCNVMGKYSAFEPPFGSFLTDIGFLVFIFPSYSLSEPIHEFMPVLCSIAVLVVTDLYCVLIRRKLPYINPIKRTGSRSLAVAELVLIIAFCAVFAAQIWSTVWWLGLMSCIVAIGICYYVSTAGRRKHERSNPITDILFDMIIVTLVIITYSESTDYRLPLLLIGAIAMVDLVRGIIMRIPEKTASI